MNLQGLINTINPAQISNVINNTLNNFIIRPILGNSSASGIMGFKFTVTGDEEETHEIDITDNYVESNISAQDNAALKPLRFTVKGYVGEIFYNGQSSLDAALSTLVGLISMSGLSPSFSVKSTQTMAKMSSTYNKINNVLGAAQSVYDLITSSTVAQSEQQKAYNHFVGLARSRQACVVETPWNILNNMMIERLGILQRDDNKYISEFTVTFKQVNIVGENLGNPVASGRAANMLSSFISKGITAGAKVSSVGATLKGGWG
jgi:hypothetical protein